MDKNLKLKYFQVQVSRNKSILKKTTISPKKLPERYKSKLAFAQKARIASSNSNMRFPREDLYHTSSFHMKANSPLTVIKKSKFATSMLRSRFPHLANTEAIAEYIAALGCTPD
jgi:hypothetical protein